MLLFSIPFFAAEVFVGCLVFFMLFFREELTLTAMGARYQAWIIWPIKDMHYELIQLQKFVVKETSNSDSPNYSLLLETTGTALSMCAGLPMVQIHWLVFDLNQQLARFKGVEISTEERKFDSQELSPEDEAPIELRPPVEAVVHRPDDSRWHKIVDFDEIRFQQRGRLGLGEFGGLLFVNLFWNGITGVFACLLLGLTPEEQQPEGAEWWFLFFFLIPFEVIGLCMFLALLIYVLEPIRTTSWVFYRNRLEYRLRWLGLGPTWHYEIQELDRLELHKKLAASAAKQSLKFPTSQLEGQHYSLKIINKKLEPICSIDSLTLAEACWMANEILTERQGWFN
jgi:hypothetical protein